MLARVLLLAVLLPASAQAAVDLPAPTIAGTAGDNGWFVSPVSVQWAPSGATGGSTGCDARYFDADTTGVTATCTARDTEGGEVSRSVTIRIDRTPPTALSAAPARPPDAPPFYTAPVAIGWSGTDATSGIAACTALTYAGSGVTPSGTCRDRAGNTAPPLPFALAYDATPPPLTNLTATPTNNTILLTWDTTADAATVSLTRGTTALLNAAPAAPRGTFTDGPLAPGTTAAYAVTVRDAAGNATTVTTTATLPAPAQAASKSKTTNNPRVLRWKRQPRASYYNVQLYTAAGRKLLSAWPRTNRYTLRASWRYAGRTHRLAAGHRYRWYVWPGYGPRAQHRYGRALAKGTLKP